MNYQFKCNYCRNEFEIKLDIDQEKINIRCPTCNSPNTIRKFRVAGIIFKGNGFYNTDNRKKEENE
jgi:putative FmdB family regulatory protein